MLGYSKFSMKKGKPLHNETIFNITILQIIKT